MPRVSKKNSIIFLT